MECSVVFKKLDGNISKWTLKVNTFPKPLFIGPFPDQYWKNHWFLVFNKEDRNQRFIYVYGLFQNITRLQCNEVTDNEMITLCNQLFVDRLSDKLFGQLDTTLGINGTNIVLIFNIDN